MTDAAWRRLLRYSRRNCEDAAKVAVIILRKRHDGGDQGGGSDDCAEKAAQRRQLRCGGRNGKAIVEVVEVIRQKVLGGGVLTKKITTGTVGIKILNQIQKSKDKQSAYSGETKNVLM